MRPPLPLLDDLGAAGTPDSGPLIGAGMRATAPDGPGAYLLVIGLARPLELDIPRFAGTVLPPGWYIYAGNANGPGGLRARVARHLRADKRVHWHVDRLTCAEAVTALCFGGADECHLADNLRSTAAFTIPLRGFGSTDCRRCQSHLLGWAGEYG